MVSLTLTVMTTVMMITLLPVSDSHCDDSDGGHNDKTIDNVDGGSKSDDTINSFLLVSPSILEIFSRLCGLSNCITWGLSQVNFFGWWKWWAIVGNCGQSSEDLHLLSGSCRSSRPCVGSRDRVRQGSPHLLPHPRLRRQDQQVPKHGGHLQEGQALHKLPCNAEEVWKEDIQLHSKGEDKRKLKSIDSLHFPPRPTTCLRRRGS